MRDWIRWGCLTLAATWAPNVCAQAAVKTSLKESNGSSTLSALHRVIHTFDFNERVRGNLEDIPKYWEPIRPRGFPHYVRAAFDDEVGHEAAPSFYLASEARNIAYQYIGPETRIRTNTDYRVVGFIRPDRLVHARACLSAHFLDKDGRPLSDTLVRSRYVGGKEDGDGWVAVELNLSAAPPEAYTIAIGAWVLQKALWRGTVPKAWHIPRNDVFSGAWFDDIVVYALPKVALSTRAPGHVIPPEGPFDLEVMLADNEDPNLRGRLSIQTADGTLLETHPVSVILDDSAEPARFSLKHLAPGLYRAVLEVYDGSERILTRRLTFARLAPRYRATEFSARSLGLVLDADFRVEPTTQVELLEHQAVRSAKLPVWTGTAGPPLTRSRRREIEGFYQELIKRGFALTGVFAGPPGDVALKDGAYVRPLIELLNGSRSVWMDHLASVVAPYATVFHSWQLGPDHAPPREPRREVVSAANRLREAMKTYLTQPRLTFPLSTTEDPTGDTLPFQQVTLILGDDVTPEDIDARVAVYRSRGYEQLAAYVEPLSGVTYRRKGRLVDWAQRVLTARHAGLDTVYVPQTWHHRETPRGNLIEPDEIYLLLRTIADLVGDAKPGPQLRLAGGIKCFAFYNGRESILAMWDRRAPREGRRVPLQLGRVERQFDLWGRSETFARDEQGRQVVHLTAMPILIPGVERWLIDFRTAWILQPDSVESGSERIKHELSVQYDGEVPVSGRVHIEVPTGWKASPVQQDFSARPQRVERYPLEIRYPHNEPVGEKTVRVDINLPNEGYYMEIGLPVRLGVKDLEVWGVAVVEGTDLLLRHVVTNRSQEVLSFRGSASVPGRARQYRPIANLQPGDTQILEYRVHNARAMIGRSVRLMLREVDDGPRVHNLNLAIP